MTDDDDLTPEGYAAQLRRLGLVLIGHDTGRTTIYKTREQELITVPNADWQTPAQRRETIEKLKRRLGFGEHLH